MDNFDRILDWVSENIYECTERSSFEGETVGLELCAFDEENGEIFACGEMKDEELEKEDEIGEGVSSFCKKASKSIDGWIERNEGFSSWEGTEEGEKKGFVVFSVNVDSVKDGKKERNHWETLARVVKGTGDLEFVDSGVITSSETGPFDRVKLMEGDELVDDEEDDGYEYTESDQDGVEEDKNIEDDVEDGEDEEPVEEKEEGEKELNEELFKMEDIKMDGIEGECMKKMNELKESIRALCVEKIKEVIEGEVFKERLKEEMVRRIGEAIDEAEDWQTFVEEYCEGYNINESLSEKVRALKENVLEPAALGKLESVCLAVEGEEANEIGKVVKGIGEESIEEFERIVMEEVEEIMGGIDFVQVIEEIDSNLKKSFEEDDEMIRRYSRLF